MGRAARSRNVVHMGRALTASPLPPPAPSCCSHGSELRAAPLRRPRPRRPGVQVGLRAARGVNLSARVTHLHGRGPSSSSRRASSRRRRRLAGGHLDGRRRDAVPVTAKLLASLECSVSPRLRAAAARRPRSTARRSAVVRRRWLSQLAPSTAAFQTIVNSPTLPGCAALSRASSRRTLARATATHSARARQRRRLL